MSETTTETKRPNINWMDVLWLVFLVGLAILPPVKEPHKQLILLAFGVVQLGESWLVMRMGRRGPAYIVLLKICLATILIDHTGEPISINSSYWPIFFLPVVLLPSTSAPGQRWHGPPSHLRRTVPISIRPCRTTRFRPKATNC